MNDIIQTSAFMTVDEALSDYPSAELVEDAAKRLNNGIPPLVSELTNQLEVLSGDLVRLVFGGRLLAMSRYAPDRQDGKKGDFELIRVFNCHAVG